MSLKKHLEKKTDKYSIGSREKLKAAMRHKIKKTFVSCLNLIESELVDKNIVSDETFRTIRSKVLDIGNDQVRNMENELEKYNIEFIPYHIELKVIPMEDYNG